MVSTLSRSVTGRARWFATPAAVLGTLTGAAVAFSLAPGHSLTAEPAPVAAVVAQAAEQTPQPTAEALNIDTRGESTSRSAQRPTDEKPAPMATIAATRITFAKTKPGTAWSTTSLRLRHAPNASGDIVATVADGDKLVTTGVTEGTWTEVEWKSKTAWAATQYLTTKQPGGQSTTDSPADPSDGDSTAPSDTGTACRQAQPGITARARVLYNAICAHFPQIKNYGTIRPDSYPAHPSGRAIDAMIPNWSGAGRSTGDELASWLRANAGKYGIQEVIWRQRIWTSQRSGDGWRSMSSRGGSTANHMDHVHVAVR